MSRKRKTQLNNPSALPPFIEVDLSIYGSASIDTTLLTTTETETDPLAAHEKAFGKELIKDAALFHRRGELIIWSTPRNKRDEKNVEKHYGRTFKHLSREEFIKEGGGEL